MTPLGWLGRKTSTQTNLPYLPYYLNKFILQPVDVCKNAVWMANSVDPDQMPHTVASDQGLHCLLRLVCPNSWGKYSKNKNEVTQEMAR